MHAKVQVFLNQPWRQMRALLNLLFGKDKSFVWKECHQEKENGIFAYVIFGKQKRNQRTKIGDDVFL